MNQRTSTKIGTLVVMTSLVSTLLAPQAFAEGTAATPAAKMKTDMELAFDKRAIIGYPNETDLRANQAVTRAEIVTMINRAAKLPDVQVKKATYTDLSDWQVQAVENATAKGIVRGVGWGAFQPNRTVTREEMAVIAVKAITNGETPDVNEEVLNYFTDKASISEWARPYVAFAVLEGIFDAKFGSEFKPQTSVTRGEAARALKPVLFDVVDILTTNDMHGAAEVGFDKTKNLARGGLETIGGIVNDYRAINPDGTVVLDAGDAWQGTLISNTVNGKVMIDAMEDIGYDAMAIGNHEFDFGLQTLKNNITDAEFPILAANIIDDATQQPVDWAQPYKMIERGGLKIGIIGLSTPQTETTTKSTNIAGLTFDQPTDYAKQWADELRKQGADLIVANSHLPGAQDAKTLVISDEVADLAQSTGSSVLDAIIAGHSHKPVAGIVNGTAIVEAWSSTTAMGHIQLYVDKDTKKVVSSNASLLETYTTLTTPDAEVKQIVANYKTQIEVKANEVEGTAAEKLNRLSYRYAINGGKDRDGITPLGAMITDAMRDSEGSDIAFTNIGGIRADIEPGEITYSEMFSVLPFGNYNVTGTMTAAQIKQAMEVLDKYTSLPAMQFSGLKVEWDNTRATGDKFTKITLEDGTPVYVDGQLNESRTFSVTTNDFMATGAGDGYVVFGEVTDWQDGAILLDAWVDYTKALTAAGQSISLQDDGRDVRLDLQQQ